MWKFLSILFSFVFVGCMDFSNKFIQLGKMYTFNDAVIISGLYYPDKNYSYEYATATISESTATINVGKINDTYNIENVLYERDEEEGVLRAKFELSKNGEESKLEICKYIDQDRYWLRLQLKEYSENKFEPCENFIQFGKVYTFDSNTVTKGNRMYEYDDASVVFSKNAINIIIGSVINIKGTIVKSSFKKNVSSPGVYHADLVLLLDGEECEAEFAIGPADRGLSILYPKPSRDVHYMLFYFH